VQRACGIHLDEFPSKQFDFAIEYVKRAAKNHRVVFG
jgi:hypothetical protein